MNHSTNRRLATLLLILACGVGLIALIDPTNSGFGSVQFAAIKYMPFWLASLSCLLYFFCSEIKLEKVEWLLIAFVIVMLLGSLWAIVIEGASLQESYMGRAMGGFVLIAFILISRHKREVCFFFRFFVPMLLACVSIMFVIVFLFRQGLVYKDLSQMYQVKVILFASASVMSVAWFKKVKLKLLVFIMMSLALFFVQKTTAIIVLAMLLGYGLYAYITVQKEKVVLSHNKMGGKGVALVGAAAVLLLAGVAVYTLIEHRTNAGAREHEVREITFTMRANEFYQSPVYGNFFTGSPQVDVAYLHIPSHSDILDMLAMGGLVSILLFFVPVFLKLMRHLRINQLTTGKNWLSFTVVISMFVMLVNPILSMPGLAFIFWMSVGLLFSRDSVVIK